ncbi:hypothetical protein HJC02_23945 [Rhizobium sp. NLR4a]|uniref:hypothetical protein n=1 Tax=Rhizobium sp. NLR4a TaxID=2731117 RepID=UPI001C83A717|nr:hypothetical protein [Rhizobium sp. NLR4a]MBX5235291.1 hypothetical protein [Rhizobium sp. NLR4a]
MAALSDVQLAALDLIIAMKKSGTAPLGFINADFSVNNLGDVAVAAASVAAVAAAVAAVPASSASVTSTSVPSAGSGISLKELMDARDAAIAKRDE